MFRITADPSFPSVLQACEVRTSFCRILRPGSPTRHVFLRRHECAPRLSSQWHSERHGGWTSMPRNAPSGDVESSRDPLPRCSCRKGTANCSEPIAEMEAKAFGVLECGDRKGGTPAMGSASRLQNSLRPGLGAIGSSSLSTPIKLVLLDFGVQRATRDPQCLGRGLDPASLG